MSELSETETQQLDVAETPIPTNLKNTKVIKKKRVIKPSGKIGKKFLNSQEMLSVLDEVINRQAAKSTIISERMSYHKKREQEIQKNIKQKRMDRKIALKEKKREIKNEGSVKKLAVKALIEEQQEKMVDGDDKKIRKKVSFK